MPNYMVRVPFAGWADVYVDADTPEEALDEAMGMVELERPKQEGQDGDWGYEAMPMITEGNICWAAFNEAFVGDDDGEDVTPNLRRWGR